MKSIYYSSVCFLRGKRQKPNMGTMNSSWLLIFLQSERCLLSLYRKAKINTPRMYEVLDKQTIKSEILRHLYVAKRGYASKRLLAEVIQCIFYKLKTGCQWQVISVFA